MGRPRLRPVDMPEGKFTYHRHKAITKSKGKAKKEEVKNEFLFDEELHKEMSKTILGYNPYQE